jgi:hypothetical protein
MGRKLAAFVIVGSLVFASVAVAKSYELEGDFGDAHPDSEVVAKVRMLDGAPGLVKLFDFSGLIAECEDGMEALISGESTRPAEIVERNGKLRFEAKLAEGGSKAQVFGKVSRRGKSANGRIEYGTSGHGGCEAKARFKLKLER